MEVKSWRELNSGKKRKKIIPRPRDRKNIDNDYNKGKSVSRPRDDSFSSKKLLDDSLNIVYNNNDSNKDENKNMTKIYTQRKLPNKSSSQYRSISKPKAKTKNSNFKKGKIIIIFLFIAVFILLLGSWRFAGQQNQTDDFQMYIEGPDKVVSGEEGVWKIKYKNLSNVSLMRMELTVKYPAGLKVRLVEPAAINNSKTVWNIGELLAGEEGEVEISAQIFSDDEGAKQLFAAMVYQPENFSSDFIEEVDYKILLNKSPIIIDYSGPDTALPETTHDWSFVFKNSGENNFTGIQIRLITSDNFIMSESEPEVLDIAKNDKEKIYLWEERSLATDQQIKYGFKGKFTASAKSIEYIKVELINLVNEEVKILQEKEINIPIMGEELLLDLSVNGKDEMEHIRGGQELDYQITIQNTSGQDLKNITASLKLTPELIDWNTLKSPVQPSISRDGLVTFTADTYKELANIPKGEKLQFSVKIKLKDQFDPQIKLKAKASVQVGMVGDKERDDVSFTTNYIISAVEQLLKFRAEANYYDDEGMPVGSGPLPPEVNKETEFVLNFYINQISGNFSSLNITTYLPANVDWIGEEKLNKGVVGYNPADRKINWVINDVNSGSQDLSASFKVSIKPQTSDIGNTIILMPASTLVGVKSNGENINLSVPALDTNLAEALFGSGQGKVMQ